MPIRVQFKYLQTYYTKNIFCLPAEKWTGILEIGGCCCRKKKLSFSFIYTNVQALCYFSARRRMAWETEKQKKNNKNCCLPNLFSLSLSLARSVARLITPLICLALLLLLSFYSRLVKRIRLNLLYSFVLFCFLHVCLNARCCCVLLTRPSRKCTSIHFCRFTRLWASISASARIHTRSTQSTHSTLSKLRIYMSVYLSYYIACCLYVHESVPVCWLGVSVSQPKKRLKFGHIWLALQTWIPFLFVHISVYHFRAKTLCVLLSDQV